MVYLYLIRRFGMCLFNTMICLVLCILNYYKQIITFIENIIQNDIIYHKFPLYPFVWLLSNLTVNVLRIQND